MEVLLTDIAKKIGISTKELRVRLVDFGFDVDINTKEIDQDTADLIIEELTQQKSTSEIYEDMISAQQDKAIIKSQRKKTAGQKKIKGKKEEESIMIEKVDTVAIEESISVKELSEKTGVPITKLIGELMKNGILANINQIIDYETAKIICSVFDIQITVKHGKIKQDAHLSRNLEELLSNDDSENLELRPPIVTIMGHVDHGKTKLLDYIRKSNVVAKEAGGITQHLGAYDISKNGKTISFIDTPGHHTFTAMRARGAQVTDIAILVVAADEGVKPQTKEAYDHIKDAGVPIIVALTKIDKPEANIDNVKGQLSEMGLQSEDWGGTTIMAPLSSITGEGVENLLDMILLVSDMEQLTANPNRPAIGTVLESHLDKNLGATVTVLVNTGELKVMDSFIVGTTFGRVKLLKNHLNKRVKSAGPSIPVILSGMNDVPEAGDILQVVKDEKIARGQAMKLKEIAKITKQNRLSGIENIISKISAGKLKYLKTILKVDTNGTLEALKDSLTKIEHEDVAIKVIHGGVGEITESDVLMASASQAVIGGLHTKTSTRVLKLAEQEGVQILSHTVIYELINELKDLLSGLLEPETVEVAVGKLEVAQIFYTKKKEMVVGCHVREGMAVNKCDLQITRDDKDIGKGSIASLQSGQKSVEEVGAGTDCGIKFKGNIQLKPGDILNLVRFEQKLKKKVK